MSEFKIEDGVPGPRAARHRESIYPFNQLSIGQSFVVPAGYLGGSGHQLQRRISGAAVAWAKRHPPRRLTTRVMPDGSVRVWRIEDREPQP